MITCNLRCHELALARGHRMNLPPGTEMHIVVRPACRCQRYGSVQESYAHHVRHGTASFEEIPPDLAEM
jgi:hypothetical protein